MQKRINFLKNYIINKNEEFMARQVFSALKEDSKSGDFKSLTDKDRLDLEINLEDDGIEMVLKLAWKKYIKEKVKSAAI